MAAAFSPLQAAPAGLADFCPDYSSPPRCESAVGLFLAGKPGDDAIIAAVNTIIDRAHHRHPFGNSCDDLEAGLGALAAAVTDPGSRSLIAELARNECGGAAAAATPLPFATGTTGFGPPSHCGASSGNGGASSGTSGQASSGNGGTSGTSGQSSTGSSGGASSGTSGQASSGNGGSSGTSGAAC